MKYICKKAYENNCKNDYCNHFSPHDFKKNCDVELAFCSGCMPVLEEIVFITKEEFEIC